MTVSCIVDNLHTGSFARTLVPGNWHDELGKQTGSTRDETILDFILHHPSRVRFE